MVLRTPACVVWDICCGIKHCLTLCTAPATTTHSKTGPLIIGPLLWYFGDNGVKDEQGVLHYDRPGYVVILAVGCLCMLGSCALVKPVRSTQGGAAAGDHGHELGERRVSGSRLSLIHI